MALSLRPPLLVYPVQSLETLVCAPRDREPTAAVLRDCITVRRGTTPEGVFELLKGHMFRVCTGEFVRAEGFLLADRERRQFRKTEPITSDCVIRIMTTKKQ